jgi:heme exporter protein A
MSGLCVNNITFCCGEALLFDRLSIKVKQGELLQIVGENGSGKSTLLRIVAGLLSPDNGELLWNGESIPELRCPLFYLGHTLGIKSQLTALENLLYDYALLGIDKKTAQEALSRLNLLSVEKKLASQLSRGQNQRLALAKLLCRPLELIILDEPFTALDCHSVSIFEKILAEKLQQKSSVILSSHFKRDFSVDIKQSIYYVS